MPSKRVNGVTSAGAGDRYRSANGSEMGLLAVAAGYRIADFGGLGDPTAIRWRGLPAHPHDLLSNQELIPFASGAAAKRLRYAACSRKP